MQESSSVFDELAKELSKDEREQILSQVNKDFLKDNNTSTGPSRLFDTETSPGKSALNINQQAIKNDLREINYFLRLLLVLKSIFTRKTLAEVYIDYKLKSMKGYIQAKGGFINFDNATIGPKLAAEAHKLYTMVLPIRNPHLSIWHNSEILNHVITSLLKLHKSVPVFKTAPTDFIGFSELLHLFIHTSDENAVKQAVLKAQRDYFNTIPSFVFRDISEQLLPYYALCSLLNYPSREMLILMGITEAAHGENAMANYKPALIDPVLPAIEEFYSILVSISMINFDKKMSEFFLKEALSHKSFDQPADNINKLVAQNISKIEELVSAVRGFLARVPMQEILAFFHRDPFYKPIDHVVKLTIKNFYIKSSAVLIGGMLSNTLQSLRLAYVNNSIDTLFKDTTLTPLKYYKQEEGNKVWSSVGLHSFIYAKAMMLCFNFLEKDYADRIANIRNVLMMQILAKVPGVQAKFQEFATNVENLKIEITIFDEKLSPSSEQGKNFGHIQTNLAENLNQVRLVQAFIDHKDAEASKLLTEVSELLAHFVKFIREKIIDTTVEAIQTQLASVYVEVDRSKPLRAILEEFVTHMYTFSFTLQELLTHEKIARHGEKSH
ncbi:MAG: DUF5312 family protein [Spirochaetia bacterium]